MKSGCLSVPDKNTNERRRSKLFRLFGNPKPASTDKPNAAVFIDYENWYIALDNNFHVQPDIAAFVDEVKLEHHLVSMTVFGDFLGGSLKNEMRKLRGYTNDIVETNNGSGRVKKDFTDFIMLDKIYQTAYQNDTVDTYIIFTGDAHFSSVVLFLKNTCRKRVIVYGVKNAFSEQLKTAASEYREIEPPDPEKIKMHRLGTAIIEQIRALEENNKDARPTFLKTVAAVASQTGDSKADCRKAMDELFELGIVSQYVKAVGKNDVKLLKVDYKKAASFGF